MRIDPIGTPSIGRPSIFPEENKSAVSISTTPVSIPSDDIELGRGLERLAEMVKAGGRVAKRISESPEFKELKEKIDKINEDRRRKIRELLSREKAEDAGEFIKDIGEVIGERVGEARELVEEKAREARARRELKKILGVKPEIVEV